MYSIWRKIVIYIFILLGIFLIVFGVVLFFDPTEDESPFKFIGIGVMMVVAALLAKRYKWIIVR